MPLKALFLVYKKMLSIYLGVFILLIKVKNPTYLNKADVKIPLLEQQAQFHNRLKNIHHGVGY